ncbi:MAG: transporter substrate-binding domain-containing protein [Microthrixaceae bacterium]
MRGRRRWRRGLLGAALLAVLVVLGVVAPAAGADSTGRTQGGDGAAVGTPGRTSLPPGSLGPDGVLTIAVREIRPFVYRAGDGWSGYSIDMWERAARALDVPYRFVEVANVGEQLDAVTSGRAQAALGAISITADRSERVDFSQPIFDSGLQVLVRSEGDSSPWRAIGSLFGPTLLLVLIGLVVLLLVVGHLVWLLERGRNDEFPRGYAAGVWEGIWWAMVTMATVGYGDTVARTRWGRVLSMVWILAGLVLVAQFTATVTSTLTVERITNEVRGIGDLYGRTVGTVRDTSSATYLENIDLPANGYADIDEATDALLDDEVDAVVYDSPVLRYFARTAGRGRTQVVGPLYQPQGYGMAFPENSPAVDAVDEEFLSLREDGTAESLEQRYFGG